MWLPGASHAGGTQSSNPLCSSDGAASALIIIFVWVYYSAQILLLGAEFAKAHGDQKSGRLSSFCCKQLMTALRAMPMASESDMPEGKNDK